MKYSGSLTQLNNKITSVKRTLTTNSANNVNVYVKYYLQTELHGATLTNCSATLFAKLTNDVSRTVASQPLNINGTVFNASFYGNGVIFSKATDQYVGMMAAPTGTQLEIRSGTKGLKVDKNGVSQYNPNGSTGASASIKQWDNSGLLIGCLVEVDGTIKKRFGIKDKPAVRCDHPSSGQYQFFHYLGHTNYIVQVTPAFWGKYIAVVYDDKADSVIVEIRNVNGGYDNVQFNITIIGTP